MIISQQSLSLTAGILCKGKSVCTVESYMYVTVALWYTELCPENRHI